jgi:hypothetical protein
MLNVIGCLGDRVASTVCLDSGNFQAQATKESVESINMVVRTANEFQDNSCENDLEEIGKDSKMFSISF